MTEAKRGGRAPGASCYKFAQSRVHDANCPDSAHGTPAASNAKERSSDDGPRGAAAGARSDSRSSPAGIGAHLGAAGVVEQSLTSAGAADLSESSHSPMPLAGVGARRAGGGAPPRGGGYQDVYAPSEFRAARAALGALRMHPVWRRAADLLGADRFIALWRLIDGDATVARGVNRQALLELPSYRAFMRAQRNRYIALLASRGLSSRAIQAKLKADLGAELSTDQISRVIVRGQT